MLSDGSRSQYRRSEASCHPLSRLSHSNLGPSQWKCGLSHPSEIACETPVYRKSIDIRRRSGVVLSRAPCTVSGKKTSTSPARKSAPTHGSLGSQSTVCPPGPSACLGQRKPFL